MALASNQITYTTNGTYSTPSVGAFAIRVLARGAGGGGTSGVTHSSTATTRKAGSGGGGGAVTPPPKLLRVADLALPLTIAVGAGGPGGAPPGAINGAWNAGSDGGTTSVVDAAGGVLARAVGGGGAPDWQIPGYGGFDDWAPIFGGANGGQNGGPGGSWNAFPIQSVSGGGGGGGGGGYDAAGNPVLNNGVNGRGGYSGLVAGAPLGGGQGDTPTLWPWCESGSGGGGGNYSATAAQVGGAGGFPAGGGGGGGGGNPAGGGGGGAGGAVTIIEYIKE